MHSTTAKRKFNTCQQRLHHEYNHLARNPPPNLIVRPHPKHGLLHCHFLIHSIDDPRYCGWYHGKLLFTQEYPYKGPSIMMISPQGRFKTNQRLCLSMSDFHPETWNPMWNIETILMGLLSFMLQDAEETYGSVKLSDQERKKLALESVRFNNSTPDFEDIFGDEIVKKQKEWHKSMKLAQQRIETRQTKRLGTTQSETPQKPFSRKLIDTMFHISILLGIILVVIYIAW